MKLRLLIKTLLVAFIFTVTSCAKVTKVEIGAGKAIITDRGDSGLSHVKIKCNNGLVIDVDWKRNPYNEYGYDIYEPVVSESYSRLAIMVTARGVIANYLNGEY